MVKGKKENPRKAAVEILNRIDETNAYAEPLLDAVLSAGRITHLSDRRLLTQIVYGTLRMRGRCDWIIGRFYRGDAALLDRTLLNILRVSIYQLLFADRIPEYAVLDEAVKIAKEMHRPGAGLVNALLRAFMRAGRTVAYPDPVREPALHLSVMHSHPLWMVEKWAGLIGLEETADLCRADNEVPPFAVRVNRLKATREGLAAALAREGCGVKTTSFSPDGLMLSHLPRPVRELRPFGEGCFLIQDEASQLIALLVDPAPGEKILDACSGTGMKTTHLAEIMGNEGRVLALDIHSGKLAALRELAKRLGISIIETLTADASLDPEGDHLQAFDRVLVDAPCSGLGTLRRNPEIKWRLTQSDTAKLPALQESILTHTAQCVKKGGVLVYSTCTISAEENDGVVRSFLAGNRDFALVRPPASIDPELIDGEGFFRTYPHRHGTDGFFGAVLRKNS